ncbi:hypothetical protein, partial [Paraburkholderia sp. GAS199]|uniref:hypothetical protein n=1 Tax=Paraburkholderia sp. GAS199 TaxID=3035126 RepID=UPI003D25C9B9
YRLLIFKDHSLRSSAFFASVIKREANYAMRLRTPSTLFAKLFSKSSSTEKCRELQHTQFSSASEANIRVPRSDARTLQNRSPGTSSDNDKSSARTTATGRAIATPRKDFESLDKN